MDSLNQNVLYISYDGMTDPLGQSQVLPYLTALSKECNFHLISFEKKERFNEYKTTIQKICDQNNIIWHPQIYTAKPPVFSTLWDIFKMFRVANKLHKKQQFKIVHCRSYISALVGLSFKNKGKAKFVFDMRGFWADERVEGGLWNTEKLIYKRIYNYFKKKEKAFFMHSDAIISLTVNGKKEILSWNLKNVSAEKITVIPCCVNLDLFNPKALVAEEKTKLRKQLGLSSEDFVLGYVGSIGTWYMLPEMLDYFTVLLRLKPNAKFFFLTGENPETILNMAKEKAISNDKIIITKGLHNEMPQYISLFDWSIFFIRPVFSKKASSPTKQGEIMAMGVPLVCNSGVGDTDFVVNKYQSGYLIKDFTDAAYLEHIKSLNLHEFDATNLAKGAHEFFGLENGANSYLSVYNSISNG